MSNATIERCQANVAMLGYLHPAFLMIHARIRNRYRVTSEPGMTMEVTANGYLLIGEQFASRLTSDELQGCLAHEMLHLVLGYFDRLGSRDEYIFNIASDMTINHALRKDGIKLPEGAVYPPLEYTGDLFSEAVYEWLLKNPQHIPPRPQGRASVGAGCGPIKEDGQDGKDGLDWKKISVEARAAASQNGSTAIGTLLSPRAGRIDFKRIIRHGFNDATSGRSRDFQTYARRPRRPTSGIILPGWGSYNTSIAVVVDASGSMSREWINVIAAETIGLMKTFPGVNVYLAVHTSVLEWSGWLSSTQSWKLNEALSFTGGTNPQPAYDAVRTAMKGRCENLIHFTDTEFGSEWPAVPAKHLIVGAFGRNISTQPPAGSQVIVCEVDGV